MAWWLLDDWHVHIALGDCLDEVPALRAGGGADCGQHLGDRMVRVPGLRPRMVCSHSRRSARSALGILVEGT